MSQNPDELRELVRGVRAVEAALGTAEKKVLEGEEAARLSGRRSLVAARRIPKGSVLDSDMLVAKRPPKGIPPERVDEVVSRRARRDIEPDQFIAWDDV